MKIIQFVPTLGSGGAEKFVVQLSNELSDLGHSVTLICLYKNVYPYDFNKKFLSSSVNFISLNKGRGFSPVALLKAMKVLNRIEPDIIHTHLEAFDYSFIYALLSFKTKFIHTVHNDAYNEVGGFRFLLRKYLFKSSRIVPVVISQESKHSFINRYKFDTYLIENGIKFSRSSNSQNPFLKYIEGYSGGKIFCNIARVSSQKNQKLLLDSFNHLIGEGFSDIYLFIIGKFNETDDIYKTLKAEIKDRIYIIGEVDNVHDYLSYSDAFCLSSKYEGLPISLLEAMSLGLVPICTSVGGISNVINDGVNGFLSKDLSIISYANAMKRFLSCSHDQLLRLKETIVHDSKMYSIDKCAYNYLKIYESTTNN